MSAIKKEGCVVVLGVGSPASFPEGKAAAVEYLKTKLLRSVGDDSDMKVRMGIKI
jgi:hypothetical protein